MYAIVLALLSALLFGASTPIGKLLLESLPPFQLAGWLYLGAAAGVVPGVVRLKNGPFHGGRIGRKNIRRLAGAIIFGGVAGPVLLLLGLQRSSAASVSLWLNLELVATALLGAALFKDYLGTIGWIGVAGTILASALLSWQGGQVVWSGLLLVSGACVCWGMDNHLTALIDGITPALSTFWKGIGAGAVNLMIGFAVEAPGGGIGPASAAMAVGVFAYGISITLYIKSAQHLGATRSQMIFSSAPFFGVVLAIPLLGETINPMQVVSAGILVASLVLLFKDRHDHTHHHVMMRHQHDHEHGDRHHEHGHTPEVSGPHNHQHRHLPLAHSHPHWPDIHHRHKHR